MLCLQPTATWHVNYLQTYKKLYFKMCMASNGTFTGYTVTIFLCKPIIGYATKSSVIEFGILLESRNERTCEFY